MDRYCVQGRAVTDFLNTRCYHPWELPWFFIGCFIWAAVYIIIIVRTNRYKFIEMPAMALSANIAWEFAWGVWPFRTNMGTFAVGTYKVWFLLDIYLFVLLWKYGDRQGWAPAIKRWFHPMLVGAILVWFWIFYEYTGSAGNEYNFPHVLRTDHYIGAITAYADNVIMSTVYVFQLARLKDYRGLSNWVAWLKMIGTGMNTVFMILVFPLDHFLITMGLALWILDMIYIFWLRHLRAAQGRGEIPGAPPLDSLEPVVAP